MRVSVDNRKLFGVLLVALIALAWLGLVVWGQSPYGRYLDHGQLAEITAKDGTLLLFFVAGWTLMVFAMMLPTSLPLITMFNTMTSGRSDHLALTSLLIVGYLATWVLFGAAVHLGDLGIHEVVEVTPWLDDNSWVIGASVLLMAGAYQFTSLKYHCLDKCRSPLSFINQHWRGRNERFQSFSLGVHHGLFCIGCCGSLMLLMFAVGAGNIGWMLVLGMVMAIEKNMPWGRQLSNPLGVLLIALSGVIVLVELSGI